MKKWFALLLTAVLCLSLTNLLLAAALCLSLGTRDGKKGESTAASSDAPANIVVDGKEIPVKDFLIAYLSNYIQSDAYLARTAKFEQAVDRKASPLL